MASRVAMPIFGCILRRALLVLIVSLCVANSALLVKEPECDACRTVIEQFYKGWHSTITTLASEGVFETVPGGAPKITYNQQIEDFLQGFCDSKWMKDFADYIIDGCRAVMKPHHRAIVGKFLHEEERMNAPFGSKTNRPHRIKDVCTVMTQSCKEDFVPSVNLTSAKDKCGACKGVVADASYILRRSKYQNMSPSALKKKKLEVFDLLEPLCNDVYYRYDDEPNARNGFCSEMWEEDEEALIAAVVEGADMERKVCVEGFKACKKGQVEL